jgi:hypothetical protein
MRELEQQAQAIVNFFVALQRLFGQEWETKENVFLYASGFAGAMNFFRSHLLDYCRALRSFETATISRALADATPEALPQQSDLRGLGGATARARIEDALHDAFDSSSAEMGDFKL